MKNLLILGGGTAGTLMANKLSRELPPKEWRITVLDKDRDHYYQPGFLFVPFSIYDLKDIVRPKKNFIASRVELRFDEADVIEPEQKRVRLKDGSYVNYDLLIIATGCYIRPDQTEGLKGELWHKEVFDFYTPKGAQALGQFFSGWKGGRLILNLSEMPIKCPVAPLEFLFLADAYFTMKNMRDKVDITYVTPLSAAFTKPIAASILGNLLTKKNIKLVTDFSLEHVDNENKAIVSYEGDEIDFDTLVTIPTNMGSSIIERSDLGDDLGFIPTNKHTLVSNAHSDIFVIGDATDLPASKAGSVAHFEADILTENVLAAVKGQSPPARFDGHANCFIESGFNKAFLIDFNYATEPLPGKFPLPVVGPFSLLQETRTNHMGKMAFKWIYWNLLIKGRHIPLAGSEMSMRGKVLPSPALPEASSTPLLPQ